MPFLLGIYPSDLKMQRSFGYNYKNITAGVTTLNVNNQSQANISMREVYKGIKTNIQQAKFAEAILLCQSQLEHNLQPSDKIEVLYLLVVGQRLQGDLHGALESNKILLKLNVEHARAWQENGYLYTALEEPKKAAQAFYQATQLNPALLASWRALAKVYAEQGQDQALQIANTQIDYLQQLPAPLLGAKDLYYDGQWLSAEQVCRQYLSGHKHDVEGMLLLAEIGLKTQSLNDAEFLLESCVELYPDHVASRVEYARLLTKLGKFKQAKQQAQQLLLAQSENNVFKLLKAGAMVGVGEIPQAIEIYQQILQRDPSLPGVHLLLGHAQKALDEFDQAILSYQRCYQINPSFGDAYWSMANTKTYRFSQTEIALMKAREKHSDTANIDKIHMCFALGKALEDSKYYDQAFVYYQRGNQMKSALCHYQAAHTSDQVEKQIKHCDAGLFKHHQQVGCTAQDPIFIVGLPRAGSTLLEQILASHSQVDGTMELHNILGLASRLVQRDGQYPANLTDIPADIFRKLGQQYIDETQVYRQGAAFFIDKMPNNFMHLGLIKLILPNAKIIDARRHPMACCFSGYKQLFGDGQEFTYDLEDIARYYNDYARLMDHWHKVLPGFVLRVKHEDVVDDVAGQIRRILDFCGLPFEQNCVDFHRTKRNIKTPSSQQVRQPIYRSGLSQWRNFESQLTPLTSALSERLTGYDNL